MTKEILLISVESPEIRIAQIRNERLFNLTIERDARILNSIFKGRVSDVVRGMDAAFVDIGLKRNALLYANDITQSKSNLKAITQLTKSGQELVVQVVRPPVGNKGARVTTKLSLPGRYTVLSTKSDEIGVSRRIEDKGLQEQLREVARTIVPAERGIIFRTEAAHASLEELQRDIESTEKTLSEVLQKARSPKLPAPALLHRDAGLLGRVARDRLNETVQEIWIDSAEEYEEFLSLTEGICPEMVERIHLYQGNRPLFEQWHISDEIALAQERVIPLAFGGTIVIDETEALCAIDVNTGRHTGKTALADTVLKTNLAAAKTAAQQIRLRNISGIIVVDFIEMKRPKDQEAVLNTLESALKEDSHYSKIAHASPSGLVEITRRRESLSLRGLLKTSCPYCSGDGKIQAPSTVAIEARRQVREFASENSSESPDTMEQLIAVTLHPEAACAFLGYANEYIRRLEETTQTQIWLSAETNLHHEAIQIESFYQKTFEESTFHSQSTSGASTLRMKNQMKVGETFTLSTDTARFPVKDPRFIVADNRLVLIENFAALESATSLNSGAKKDSKKLSVTVTASGRWYLSGWISTDQRTEQ